MKVKHSLLAGPDLIWRKAILRDLPICMDVRKGRIGVHPAFFRAVLSASHSDNKKGRKE